MKLKDMCKRTLPAVLIGSMLFGFTACAKTPDSSIVKQKDVDRLREDAKKTPDEDETLKETAKKAPKHYDYTYENEDKTLTVKADADVWLPDKDTIPMYEASGEGFSQELTSAAYNYFFEGKETYRLEGTDMTKAKCQEKILECKQKIAEAENDTELTEEQRQDLISYKSDELKRWQGMYEDAPEKSTLHKVSVDDQLKVQEECKTENENDVVYGVDCQTEDEYFLVINAPVDSSGWSTMGYTRNTELNYSGQQGEELITDEQKHNAEDAIGIALSEAREKADDFFKQINADVQVVASMGIRGFTMVSSDSEQEDDFETIHASEEYTAYKFVYAKSVDDIPLAVTSNSQVSDDETSLIWCYENIYVLVDKSGIIDVHWEFPTEIKKSVSNNVGIISFDQAAKTFEQMMPIIYEGEIEERTGSNEKSSMTININVNQVNMSLMRVRDSGGERTGVLTPTWVFYGSVTYNSHSYYEDTGKWEDFEYSEEAPWIVLAVNAVDGSVIDIVEGY